MNRKLLYVLMSAGHRHRYAGTTGLCTVCGKEHWPHEYDTDGICIVCGYVKPADLVSAGVSLTGGGKNPPVAQITWGFSAGSSPVGNLNITGSYTYSFLQVYSPETWFTYASYEFPLQTFPAGGSGQIVVLDHAMEYGTVENKVVISLNISYPYRNQTRTVEQELRVARWLDEV